MMIMMRRMVMRKDDYDEDGYEEDDYDEDGYEDDD